MTIRYILPMLLLAQLSSAQTGQINVARVEQMPNLPSPYNVRDWKSVATQYDSIAYDVNQSGQYLPLLNLQNSGINYPLSPAFGLHTYVGTNSPDGNEAINVLPSLVGASLCGVDKSNQFGQNWLEMSRDFFNKNSGENIYLNNKGGGSGSDWWYDLMPNVYFYQLCDLYPPSAGSRAELQFTAVADRFLASVRALGGSDTPWKKGNFDYRAFNFSTMQANPNGVHEPEAAGAYAWVLYHAYKKTGNPAYLKGAEWALEFLSDWPNNPSYELQLPYGTLTAAMMNAEIGTRYDVEKMLNWSFNRGELRGWGTIVGSWGGFDVSGLVGEANDGGNDYAFQLNGLQQAAALVPLVRYDKRFARAIGKWVLNLSNATRLFYPAFLPANQQDATVWSNAHDPEHVVGYEALREKWQGFSPFSTGDALQGNWAETNLSLYSTGSIGYLGSMVEKTNVDKILKINVLKTDFLNSSAYPSFLYFNPFTTTKTVKIQIGNTPSDVYDAISETFIWQNVSGENDLVIPANQALLVSICPASAAISFQNNRMLLDVIVVDYAQTTQNWVRGPRIQSLAAAQNVVEFGQSIDLFAKIQVGDSPNVETIWSSTNGTLSSNAGVAFWTAPASAGNTLITLIVRDDNDFRDTAILELTIVPEINKAPNISDLQKSTPYVSLGGTVLFDCIATDPNNDPLTYQWTFSSGTFTGSGNSVQWSAPASEGIYDIKVKVQDDGGLTAEWTTKILVRNFPSSGGNLVAHYPFSGNATDLTVNQLHGQPFNTAYVADVFTTPQKAMYFNGVNSRITVPLQPVLNFQDGITVACWFNAHDLPTKESFLISHGSWQNRWKISFTPDKKLRWTVNSLLGTGDLDSESAFIPDSFYHIAVTYDGQLMAMYVNGTLHSYRILTGKIRTTTLPLLMGQMLPGLADYNFKGVLDEVKIFDFALSPNAAQSLYNTSSTGTHGPQTAQLPLRLSPNPVAGTLQIDLSDFSEKNALISIYNGAGVLVFEEKPASKTVLDLPVQDWKAGHYLIILKANSVRAQAIFIKS